jgi:hypothetical protein
MKRFARGSVISLVAVLQLASASLAQDASPSPATMSGDPLPFADYVAALDAFRDNDPFAGMGDPPTQEQVVAGFEKLVEYATIEQERLQAVVPEECYAEAHQELLGYWQSSIEVTAEAATQLATSASIEAIGPIAEAMDQILYSRHPIAYVEATDGSGGFQGSPFNILAAMATCEAPEPASEPEALPTSMAPESPTP